MHLRKIVSTFYKDHPKMLTAISASLDFALLMAKPTIQLPVKQKQGRPIERVMKFVKWGDKEEAIRKNPSQYSSSAKSWRVAKDLTPWCRERRKAYNSSLTIGSLTPKELHSTLFWPCPLSSKSLIYQTTSLLSLLIPVFPSRFLVQVGRFYHWQYLHL